MARMAIAMSRQPLLRISATDAKNRFGQVLESAQRAPVVIEKAGRRHTVVMSAEQFDSLLEKRRARSTDAARHFYAQHREWFDWQNDLVEKHGVFGEEWRAW